MADSTFRKIQSFDLDPVYISLGLAPQAFQAGHGANNSRQSLVALNGPGDTLWLFKGSDYFTFNLRTKTVERGPERIENWASRSSRGLPHAFRNGIDVAFWGGEAFPNFWYFFKDKEYVRLNSRALNISAASAASPFEHHLFVDHGPASIEDWLRLPEGSSAIFKENRFPGAAVHGVRHLKGKILFFERVDSVNQHSLFTGLFEDQNSAWDFFGWDQFDWRPTVDLAFYGTGVEQDHLFLFSGTECGRYDTKTKTLLKVEPIEKSFESLSVFIPRPQLFLVEDYSMEVHVGPPIRGALAGAFLVFPHQTEKMVVITEVVAEAKTAARQNLLQSATGTTVTNFYNRMEGREDSSATTNSYRHRLQALFHGEAQAKGVWGGEVDASLNVQGGTDEQRESFAKSAFNALESQVQDSTQVTESRVATEEATKTLKTTEFVSRVIERSNPSNKTLETRVFSLIEPYVALLTLKNVRAAFTDGLSPPKIFSLVELQQRLPELLVAQSPISQLMRYVRTELANIQNSAGATCSILDDSDPSGLRINNQIRSEYSIDIAPGQTIATRGIIKSAHETTLHTDKMAPEDVHLNPPS
jgi:hypothetical protein